MQAVEQVFAEAAVLHVGDQVAVGRGDQPHVDLDRLARADRLDLAFLDRAQELHLRGRRQFADLVEEQRAACGFDELADVAVGGAGEGALLVAEQDRLDEIVGDGAAIDRDERLRRGARRVPWMARAISSLPTPDWPSISTGMAEPAAFSAWRSTACMRGLRVMMSLKVSVPERLRLMRWISLSSALVASALRKRHLQPLGADRLDHEIGRARAHRRDHVVDAAMRGLHDHRNGDAGLAHAGEHAEAVEIGHHEIEHDAVDRAAVGAGQQLGRGVAAVGDDDLVADARDHVFEQPALHRIVVDDENTLDHVRTSLTH